jgi:hypothetical protein
MLEDFPQLWSLYVGNALLHHVSSSMGVIEELEANAGPGRFGPPLIERKCSMIIWPRRRRKSPVRPVSALWWIILPPLRWLSDCPDRQVLLEDAPNGALLHLLTDSTLSRDLHRAIRAELHARLQELSHWTETEAAV